MTLVIALIVAVVAINVATVDMGRDADTSDTEPGWGTATLIESDDTGNAAVPHVAIDGSGNAIAVWYQSCGGTWNSIYSNRYVIGTGWDTPALIETDNAGNAINPQVAVDVSGNATAVWQQYDGTRYNVWSNRYTAGVGWGIAALIESNNTGSATHPQVAVDDSGNAIVVWSQGGGMIRSDIWSNRYVAGVGWDAATIVETNDTGSAIYPEVAVDSSGNATAVWHQYDGIRYNIWSNRFVLETGWDTAALIENTTGDAVGPQVAVDGSGNAVAVWRQDEGARDSIYSNRYVVGTGWGTAMLIETNTEAASLPEVAVDGSGNAIAVWCQYDGTRTSIWSNRYVVGTGWGVATLIETDNAGDAYYPQVAADASGNAIAVWYKSDGTRTNIWSNRYVVGMGWGIAMLIETDDAGYAWGPQVAVDNWGNAIAVWYQSDGTRTNIWSNRYEVGEVIPEFSLLVATSLSLLVVIGMVVVRRHRAN